MSVVLGPFEIVALVISLGGVAKLVSPAAFAATAAALGVPVGRAGARTVGGAEVAGGIAAMVAGGRVAATALAVVYVAFAAVVVAARRVDAASCGCFGAAKAPPNLVHVVVDLASAAVAVAAAVLGPVPPIAATLSAQPWAGVPLAVAVVAGALLVVAADTLGSELAGAIGAFGTSRAAAR